MDEDYEIEHISDIEAILELMEPKYLQYYSPYLAIYFKNIHDAAFLSAIIDSYMMSRKIDSKHDKYFHKRGFFRCTPEDVYMRSGLSKFLQGKCYNRLEKHQLLDRHVFGHPPRRGYKLDVKNLVKLMKKVLKCPKVKEVRNRKQFIISDMVNKQRAKNVHLTDLEYNNLLKHYGFDLVSMVIRAISHQKEEIPEEEWKEDYMMCLRLCKAYLKEQGLPPVRINVSHYNLYDYPDEEEDHD